MYCKDSILLERNKTKTKTKKLQMEVTKKQQRLLLIPAEHYEETLKDFKDTKVNTNMRLIIFTEVT